MLFNSYAFMLVFLPLVLFGWWVILRTPKQRMAFLAASSFAFYGYYDFPTGAKLIPLLILTIAVGYYTGRAMTASQNQTARKWWLASTLVFNVVMLGCFKYLGFFATTANFFLGVAGVRPEVPVLEVIFPIGISFYTFTSMSYSIDMYRRSVPPARSMLEYATFMTFFPHLVMGPVVRFSEMGPQLRDLPRRLSDAMLVSGIFFFVCGLVKKLVLADAIAPTVDRLFAASDQLAFVSGWVAAVGYSLQLYFDFSAYSDMAVGAALLLGFHFPQNFNSPYKAASLSEFWSRWHMTLSRWLRDYLYFPLGGSRKGWIKTLRNVVIVMFVGGLWHGGNWTFVVWGLAHGALLVVENVAKKKGYVLPYRWMKQAMMLFWVILLRVIFRAPTLAISFTIMAAMFGANGLGLDQVTRTAADGANVPITMIAMMFLMFAFTLIAPNTWEIVIKPNRRRALQLGMALGACVLILAVPAPFIYIQF